MTEVEDPDDLYALDPAEFVAARNALAKRLRGAGEREQAAAVSARRRPNAPAWALDQVARADPQLVGAALAAGADLRAATDAALAGDASRLREAAAVDRSATAALVDAALAHLPAGNAGLRERLVATVRAAVLDDDLAAQLRRGVLEVDHAQPGLGFAGAPTATVTDLAPRRAAKAAERKAARAAGAATSAATSARGSATAPRGERASGGGMGERTDRPPAEPRRDRGAERAQAAAERAARLRAEREARSRRAALVAEATRARRLADQLVTKADRAERAAADARAQADAAVADAARADAAVAELDP